MSDILTPSEIVEIKEYAQKLMSGKFFCEYNKEDENAYRRIMIAKYNDALRNALDSVGFDLKSDSHAKTIYIQKQPDLLGPTTDIDAFTTRVLLVLIKFFLSERRKLDSANTTFYKWNTLLADLPFVKNNSDKRRLVNVLWHLKDSGVLNVNTIKERMFEQDEDGYVAVEIYPSIQCICNLRALNEVETKLTELVYGAEEERGE